MQGMLPWNLLFGHIIRWHDLENQLSEHRKDLILQAFFPYGENTRHRKIWRRFGSLLVYWKRS